MCARAAASDRLENMQAPGCAPPARLALQPTRQVCPYRHQRQHPMRLRDGVPILFLRLTSILMRVDVYAERAERVTGVVAEQAPALAPLAPLDYTQLQVRGRCMRAPPFC